MSAELVREIHYNYAKTAKKFVGFDIIDNGKEISVLRGQGSSDGIEKMSQVTIFDKEEKKELRILLNRVEEICQLNQ